MNSDNFEQRLRRQSPRQMPTGWREEILSAVTNAVSRHSSPFARHSLLSTINHQLSTLLWPHPRAWAGLAAVWLVILAVNFSARDDSAAVAKKVSPLTPEMRMVLKQQKMILAELIEPRETPMAEPRKLYPPKPRSELRNEFAIS